MVYYNDRSVNITTAAIRSSASRTNIMPVRPTAPRDSPVVSLARAAAFATCLAAACLVPSLFDPRAERVFDAPKALVMWSLAGVAAACMLTVAIADRRRPLADLGRLHAGTAILAAGATMAIASVIAAVGSIAPRAAWTGSYVRWFGAYTSLSGFVFLVSIAVAIRTERQIRVLFGAFLLASVVPAVYALCQGAGVDVAVWNNPTARATSTAGNPIFLGGYLIMVWPVTLAYAVIAYRWLSNRAATIAATTLLAAQTVAVAFTGSVGASLGLLVAMAALTCVLLDRFSRPLRFTMVIALTTIVAVSGELAVRRRPIDLRATTPPTASGPSQSGQVRLLLWRSAIDLIRREPARIITGYGPDSIRWTLGAQDPVALRRLEGVAAADRAHNAFLDVLLTTGVLGLVGYTFLFVAIAVVTLRRVGSIVSVRDRRWLVTSIAGTIIIAGVVVLRIDPRGGLLPLVWSSGIVGGALLFTTAQGLRRRTVTPLRRDDLLCAAVFAGVAGHYVEIQTGIATASSELALWLFAGAIVVLASGDLAHTEQPSWRSEPYVAFAVLTGLMLAVLAFSFGDQLFGAGRPRLLLLALAGSAFLCGAALSAPERRGIAAAGGRFVAISVAIWATFLIVSHTGSVLPGDIAKYAAVQLLGLGVTITCCVGALMVSSTHSPSIGKPAVAIGLSLFAAGMLARNLTRLYADELSGIGSAFGAIGRWEDAIRAHEQSVMWAPDEDAYRARLGQAQIAAFEHLHDDPARQPRAKDAYVIASRLAPYEPTYLVQLAFIESEWTDDRSGSADDHLRRADEYLAAAARLVPRDPLVWTARARIDLRRQQFARANEALERSLTLDPGSADAHLLYADTLVAVDKPAQALVEYQTAERLGLADPLPAVSGRALALVRLDRLTEAIAANLEALRIAPVNYTTRKNLAVLYEQTGDVRNAIAYAVQAAAGADPADRADLDAFIETLRARLRAEETRSR